MAMSGRGRLQYQVSLAKRNSWHAGGVADCLYQPTGVLDLQRFMAKLPPDEPVTWLGLGSNVLVRAGGVRGTVILTLAGLGQLAVVDKTAAVPWGIKVPAGQALVRAEAGVTCAKLAKLCQRQGWLAGTFFAGIPGTVGGALAMNAGAFGGETWAAVCAVEVLDRRGEVQVLSAAAYQAGYRSVQPVIPAPIPYWFTAAYFAWPQVEVETAKPAKTQPTPIQTLLKRRAAAQPIGQLSCGSVFKNPAGDSAGRLIEAAGLKGLRIGGAVVSEKHANFILNDRGATPGDLEQLIVQVQWIVYQQHGVWLEPEVRMIGEA